MRGTVFVNPDSGPDDSPGREEIEEALPGWQVVELGDPSRLADLLGSAVEAGGAVAVAGGDGTIRSAAEVLAGTGRSFLPIPAGTRNHFARELGLSGMDEVAAAVVEGSSRSVSVGRVNGRAFVNNASIGLYPDLVRRRERHQRVRFRSKPVANLTAAVELLRQGRPLQVEVAGHDVSAWMVFVGNGRYGDGFSDIIERESLESDVLDVRIVRADRPYARTRVVAALLSGRLRRSKLIICQEVADLMVGMQRASIDVALDGEVIRLKAPLRFSVEQSALVVIAPSPSPE